MGRPPRAHLLGEGRSRSVAEGCHRAWSLADRRACRRCRRANEGV